MPAPAANPDPFLTEEHQRAQRIFARLMAGRVDPRHRRLGKLERPPGAADRPRAARSPRRQPRRRLRAPPDRAARAGARPRSAPRSTPASLRRRMPIVRILDHLNRLAPERLRLKATFQKDRRRGRQDGGAARPARRGARGAGAETPRRPRQGFRENAAKPNSGRKSLITQKTAKRLIRRPQSFQRLKGPQAKRFVSHGETRLRRK